MYFVQEYCLKLTVLDFPMLVAFRGYTHSLC